MVLEFFTTQPSVLLHSRYVYADNELVPLASLSDNDVRAIVEVLRNDEFARKAFTHLQLTGITSLRAKLNHFCDCNFGKLDSINDVDENGVVNYEKVECSIRSSCKNKGKVCKLY